ncbi:hypothetical protein PRZ48_006279 [Zasmidium cellare]|uniref:Uncharacterized protein n=1 Tax=Zasmidium cellare TaxID=395010 RepID=A0ABR0EPX4_ZASCE|nr:hypothetical protein PRZ48_006279 [Zasmidium cellare]
MPDDPLYIGLSISLYAWAGTILSALGLAGIVTKRPTLITSFAHFLLIDTFVSAICRILVLQFFVEAFHDHNICSNGFEPTWSPQNFRHDIVTSVRWQQENLWHFNHKRRCRVALGAVQVVLVAILICLTVAQGMLAVRMRRFARDTERPRAGVAKPRRSPQPQMDREKARFDVV